MFCPVIKLVAVKLLSGRSTSTVNFVMSFILEEKESNIQIESNRIKVFKSEPRVVGVGDERPERHDGVHGRDEAAVAQPHRVEPLDCLILDDKMMVQQL